MSPALELERGRQRHQGEHSWRRLPEWASEGGIRKPGPEDPGAHLPGIPDVLQGHCDSWTWLGMSTSTGALKRLRTQPPQASDWPGSGGTGGLDPIIWARTSQGDMEGTLC